MNSTPATKTDLMSLCLAGRMTATEGSNRRHVAEPDVALAGMMTAVLWQAVKDYLWMLANGMIAEGEAFGLSAQGEAFGTMVAANGSVSRTNGQNIEGRCAGGARGMRELLWTLKGRNLAAICEFTNFEASRIRARLSGLHARYREHAEDVRRHLAKILNAEAL